MKKLYVGNIPYKFTANDIMALFAAFASASNAIVIKDKITKRSKGFGFIEMDDNDMQQAIAQLNGKEIEGRAIVVNEARPMVQK